MNRRGFLAALGAGASAFALDPDALLWIRGAKTISVPAPRAVRSFIDACAAQQDAIDVETGIRLIRTCSEAEARTMLQTLFIMGAPTASYSITVLPRAGN